MFIRSVIKWIAIVSGANFDDYFLRVYIQFGHTFVFGRVAAEDLITPHVVARSLLVNRVDSRRASFATFFELLRWWKTLLMLAGLYDQQQSASTEVGLWKVKSFVDSID